MIQKSYKRLIILTLAIVTLGLSLPAWTEGFHGGAREALGPKFDTHPQHFKAPKFKPLKNRDNSSTASWLLWHEIALYATGLDHTPVASEETRIFGEQLGPVRSSRAMAIIHIAMFEAINAISRRNQSYTGIPPVKPSTSMRAAIAQAAYETLAAEFPSQEPAFFQQLTADLSELKNEKQKTDGIALGHLAAKSILGLRVNDRSGYSEPCVISVLCPHNFFETSSMPGMWRQDPVSMIPIALGAYWGEVKPFVLESSAQFRAPQPPALTSPEYTAAFNEVKKLGGDGDITRTDRSAKQTTIGIFWAYDGMPSLSAPPRLYNQIALIIAGLKHTNNVDDLARLFALVNVAMADAGNAAWESKYFYEYWRPVTGIREADPGTGSTGAGDGNDDTLGDPTFSPLGAPASNLNGPNFTPPFPAYPSGHATFGGALFQTLRNYYRTDHIPFTLVSDEFNGITKDHDGNVRPVTPRSFGTLSQAEEENGQSRIYLGIHWAFDKTAGIAQGRKVADYVFMNAFLPVK